MGGEIFQQCRIHQLHLHGNAPFTARQIVSIAMSALSAMGSMTVPTTV